MDIYCDLTLDWKIKKIFTLKKNQINNNDKKNEFLFSSLVQWKCVIL